MIFVLRGLETILAPRDLKTTFAGTHVGFISKAAERFANIEMHFNIKPFRPKTHLQTFFVEL